MVVMSLTFHFSFLYYHEKGTLLLCHDFRLEPEERLSLSCPPVDKLEHWYLVSPSYLPRFLMPSKRPNSLKPLDGDCEALVMIVVPDII